MRTLSTSFLAGAAVAVAAAAAGAQTQHVFPVQAATAEGDTAVSDFTGGVPWWSNPDYTTPNAQHFRMQLISDLPGSMKGMITQMAFRRDASAFAGFNLETFIAEIEVTLSTSPLRAQTAVPVFANNAGADAVTVIARRRVAFPTQTFQGSFPEPFGMTLRFDQPFSYDAAQGSLCMEVKHWENDLQHPARLTKWVIAADAMTSSTRGATMSNGPRCAPPNPWSPPIEFHMEAFVDDSSGMPMLNIFGWRQHAQHHSRAIMFASLGLSNPGVPVPPNPTTGAPGCGNMLVDFNQQLFWALSNSNDLGQVRWPADPTRYLFSFPYDPSMGGFQLYAQELNYEVHNLDYSASNWVGLQMPIWLGSGANFPLRVIHESGPTSHSAVTGTVGPLGVGPVIRYTVL